MSCSDSELITKRDVNDSPVKKKTKSKLYLKMPSFLRSKHHQEDYIYEDEKGANDEKYPKIAKEDDDSSSEKDEEIEESTSDLATPFKSSGACSASVLHEPIWPMTPPDSLHSCLRMKRHRSATVTEGEDLEAKLCQSRCNHVTFSPDTVDPLPRLCSYRKYIESVSKCPFRNLKHEKHKQKMGQLKKVNLSEFLSASYQHSPLAFPLSCDMMF